MISILLLLFVSRSWAVSLHPRDLILPNLNSTHLDSDFSLNQSSLNANSSNSNFRAGPTVRCSNVITERLTWLSCYNAWEKMFGLPGGAEELHFLGRSVRPRPPSTTVTTPIRWLSDDGKCAIDLEMTKKRTPQGETDAGDDAYGDSVIEAARLVLDKCVEDKGDNGLVQGFSDNGRLFMRFRSYENSLSLIRCGNTPPSPPITAETQHEVAEALMLLPTNERAVTTFNHSRKAGPEGTKEVTYLLPRMEPGGARNVILVDMLGDQVTSGSWWDIWTAGVAIYTMCIRSGKAGVASNLGRDGRLFIGISARVVHKTEPFVI